MKGDFSMMDKKKEVRYEMQNLLLLILKYLKYEIDDIAYLELNDGLVSVENALRNYINNKEK